MILSVNFGSMIFQIYIAGLKQTKKKLAMSNIKNLNPSVSNNLSMISYLKILRPFLGFNHTTTDSTKLKKKGFYIKL